MKEPVIVNGNNYEKDAITQLVLETGKDDNGVAVDINDENQFLPSFEDI